MFMTFLTACGLRNEILQYSYTVTGSLYMPSLTLTLYLG